MALSGILNAHLIVAAAIERHGTDAPKKHDLPRMATGDLRPSIGLTAPNAGSAWQAIRATATLDTRRQRCQWQQDVDYEQHARPTAPSSTP